MPVRTVKRVCRCGTVFQSFGSVKCGECEKWNTYITTHPQIEKKEITILPELRFFFHRTMITNVFDRNGFVITGSFEQDKKDKNKYSIHIYLCNHDPMDKDLIKKICVSLSHEWFHKTVTIDCDEREASKLLDDSGLLKRLQLEGYL